LKHSVSVSGHRTSLSLEEPFWAALVTAAHEEGKPMAQLIAEIDKERKGLNLSSAVRVWLLNRLSTERDQLRASKPKD
jgi:predicted DNA-binding ribbon-helix-helix protein